MVILYLQCGTFTEREMQALHKPSTTRSEFAHLHENCDSAQSMTNYAKTVTQDTFEYKNGRKRF